MALQTVFSKASLAVILSRLEVFSSPDWKLEQFPTDSEVAADLLWSMFMDGEISRQRIVDMGCGTGVLGIGALLLGAEHVTFIDIHDESLQILEKNIEWTRTNHDLPTTVWQYKIIHSDVHALDTDTPYHADVVIENPPFGTKQRSHIDRVFLLEAFKIAPRVFSFHKTTSDTFIQKLSDDNGFVAVVYRRYAFPLKKTQHYHKTKNKKIDVTAYRCIKKE